MLGGFTFCDTDIHDIGLDYVPDLENTYVYRPGESDVHVETFDGHHGGYYYGTWRKPKEFVLRCYFEAEQLDKGIMERIYSLFRIGKTGKLVFRRRPWCYYYATVIEINDREIYNFENGVVVITMQAMYPFARCDTFYNNIDEAYSESLLNTTALAERAEQVLPMQFINLTQYTSTPLLLCNPGTERAAVAIKIAGDVGDGVIIENLTTKQLMKVVALTKPITTNVSKYLYIDGINGKTLLIGPGETKHAFLYHDFGFIELEPSYPCKRNVSITYSDGSTSIYLGEAVGDDVIGKYIFADHSWHKITGHPSEQTIRINEAVSNSGTETTIIMSMNEITITPITTMNLDTLEFVYKPTFA